jgi:hypothetical protein
VTTKALASLILVATLVSGCGVFVAPSPTAGALTDIVSALVLRNMTITDQVSGDAGCPDPTLYGNAIRYDVSMAGETVSHPVFVFGWKDQATFDAAKAAFDACVENYALTNRVKSWAVLDDHAPWRAYGPGWPIGLREAVDEALVEAGGAP